MTLLEILVAISLLSLVGAGAFRALQVFSGRAGENLGKRLLLQMEARRALLSLYRELQEGLEIILPKPGSTIPYVVFRDFVNDIHVIYPTPDEPLSKAENADLFRVMEVVYDPSGENPVVTRPLLRNVTKIQFTAHDPGGLLITCSMLGAKGRFSLVNFVRLRNIDSNDFD